MLCMWSTISSSLDTVLGCWASVNLTVCRVALHMHPMFDIVFSIKVSVILIDK